MVGSPPENCTTCGLPSVRDEVVEHLFHFFQRQAEAGSRFGEAQRTLHVAGAVDLDDAEAGVLLVVRAEAAIVRAAVLDFGGEGERNGAGLVEFRGTGVGSASP